MSESAEGIIAATPQAASASIHELRRRRIHPHFAGYLCVLRAAAVAGSTQDIKVNFKQFFDEFLAYGNAPEKRPYVVPFSDSRRTSSIFFNRNVAGSYAPSSLRPGHAFTQVVSVAGSKADARYTLPATHAQAALRYLLYGQKLPIVPLSVFLYRDYGFEEDINTPDFQVFVVQLLMEFGFEGLGIAASSELFDTDFSYLHGMEVTQHIGTGKVG